MVLLTLMPEEVFHEIISDGSYFLRFSTGFPLLFTKAGMFSVALCKNSTWKSMSRRFMKLFLILTGNLTRPKAFGNSQG